MLMQNAFKVSRLSNINAQIANLFNPWKLPSTACGDATASQRGPTRIQHDFLALIDIPSQFSSCSHLSKSFCSTHTDGATSIMSSAYTSPSPPQAEALLLVLCHYQLKLSNQLEDTFTLSRCKSAPTPSPQS